MPKNDPTVEERLAVRLIRKFEDVVDVERLVPSGSVRTPDWRLTMADGRVADVEVIWDVDGAAQRFEKQLGVVREDENTLRRRHSPREWPDARLTLVWDVRVFLHGLAYEKCWVESLVEELVEALVAVLAGVEAEGGEPAQMVEVAQRRLVEPMEYLDGHDWGTKWAEANARGVDFEKFMLGWGSDTGYWFPRLLVVASDTLPPSFHIRGAARPEGSDCGMVRTSPAIYDFAVGEYEHMLATVQQHIDKKTAKCQMEQAPDLRWLFVVLGDNMAADQLDDYFGPASEELDPSERNPYHVLDTLTFDYFDEVWITGTASQARDIVLRLFKTGDAPQHKIVRRAEVLAG